MILDEYRFCRREIWTPASAEKPGRKPKPLGETTRHDRHERAVTGVPVPEPGDCADHPQARSFT